MLVAGLLGVSVALRELIVTLPHVRLGYLFSRMRAILYVMISAAFASGLLWLLRYLSEPSNRLAAVEQIALAALGAGVAVKGPRAQLTNARGEGASIPGVARAGAIIDQLLRTLSQEIGQDVRNKQTRLVAAAAHVKYEIAFPMFIEHLGHSGISLDDDKTEKERREELNRQRERIDALAIESDEVARDALLYLVLERGGESYLSTLMDTYDIRTERERQRPRWFRLRRRARYRRWKLKADAHRREVLNSDASVRFSHQRFAPRRRVRSALLVRAAASRCHFVLGPPARAPGRQHSTLDWRRAADLRRCL